MALFGVGGDGRARARSGARRLADRELQLALRVLHQPADRRARLPRHDRRSCRTTERKAAAKLDWFGFGTLSLAIGALAGPARPRRAARLVRLRRDLDRGDRRGLGVLSVSRPHLHGRRALRAPGAVPRPQFRGRHALHRHRRPHLLRLDGAAAALSAESHELSGRHGRPGDGAARHRHDGRHDGGRPAGRARLDTRLLLAIGLGLTAWVVLRDDRLDARRVAGGRSSSSGWSRAPVSAFCSCRSAR